MKFFGRGVRLFFVVGGALVLTTLSIDATDALRGTQSALSILTREVTEGGCPSGMQPVEYPDRARFCVDIYEVSPGPDCPHSAPGSSIETAENANTSTCLPVSMENKQPWVHVAKVQAEQLCARAGKRLPQPQEWSLAAAGTPDAAGVCNTLGQLAQTGKSPNCVSGAGMYDMVGNVWEWVVGEVHDGQYEGQTLPAEGYVAAVNEQGIPTQTTTTPQVIFNEDYFWSEAEGEWAVMRGGFHGSRSDAGVYSVHAGVATAFESAAVGFRCVKPL